LSLAIAWYLDRYSRKAEDQTYTYGYRRFALLGALLTTVLLLAGSLYILSQAIPRLLDPQHSNAQGMLVLALVGIAVNGLGAFKLHGESSLNARAIAWHLVEDVLGWVAVLVVSLVTLVADIHILDPILSILIAVYILFNVVRNLRKTTALFLQAVPEELNPAEIRKKIEAVPGVKATHHLHAWSLEGESHVLTLHVLVDENAERDQVKVLRRSIRNLLHPLHLAHTTIEIEYGPDDCMQHTP
jgi:cobalt-zinc-cadmium efflux system protein